MICGRSLHGPWGTLPEPGVTQVAKRHPQPVRAFYRALRRRGQSKLATVLKVTKALASAFMPMPLLCEG